MEAVENMPHLSECMSKHRTEEQGDDLTPPVQPIRSLPGRFGDLGYGIARVR